MLDLTNHFTLSVSRSHCNDLQSSSLTEDLRVKMKSGNCLEGGSVLEDLSPPFLSVFSDCLLQQLHIGNM